MLRLVLGFQTPDLNESPRVLYAGHDGDAALEAVSGSILPRVEVAHQLVMRPVRRWSEEGAAEYAKHAAELPPRPPTMEEGLAMVEEIKRLEARVKELQDRISAPPPLPAPAVQVSDSERQLMELSTEDLLSVASTFDVPVVEPLDRAAVIQAIIAKSV